VETEKQLRQKWRLLNATMDETTSMATGTTSSDRARTAVTARLDHDRALTMIIEGQEVVPARVFRFVRRRAEAGGFDMEVIDGVDAIKEYLRP